MLSTDSDPFGRWRRGGALCYYKSGRTAVREGSVYGTASGDSEVRTAELLSVAVRPQKCAGDHKALRISSVSDESPMAPPATPWDWEDLN